MLLTTLRVVTTVQEQQARIFNLNEEIQFNCDFFGNITAELRNQYLP